MPGGQLANQTERDWLEAHRLFQKLNRKELVLEPEGMGKEEKVQKKAELGCSTWASLEQKAREHYRKMRQETEQGNWEKVNFMGRWSPVMAEMGGNSGMDKTQEAGLQTAGTRQKQSLGRAGEDISTGRLTLLMEWDKWAASKTRELLSLVTVHELISPSKYWGLLLEVCHHADIKIPLIR